MITVSKTDLSNKKKFQTKVKDYLSNFSRLSVYREEDVSKLILSAFRAKEPGVVNITIYGRGERYNSDVKNLGDWIKKKVLPNTVAINVDESDLLKLMVFSLVMPYKMIRGETRATISEKVSRGKQRDFVQIFSDQFIGKIGEIAFKKFVKEKFNKDITLDWDINRDINTFKSDIVDSIETVSIKSTDTLESIWAEAPSTAKYGIFVKVAMPKDFFLKILAHISSLKKLLLYVEERVEKNDDSSTMLRYLEKAAYEEQLTIKAYICGFFATSSDTLKNEGENLDYLGDVRGNKHLIECSKLKYSREDWNHFLYTVLPQ